MKEEALIINLQCSNFSLTVRRRILGSNFEILTLIDDLENLDKVQNENIGFHFIDKRKVELLVVLVLLNLLFEQDWSAK